MLDSSTRKFRLYFLVILQSLLLQQCLLQLNVSCEAHDPSKPLMSLTSTDTEAKTSDDITSEPVFTELQLDVPGGRVKGMANRLKEAANLVIAPAKNYYQLIQRYEHWRGKYNQLQHEFGHDHLTEEPILPDAIDVLRIEYAKLDQQLHEEICDEANADTESANVKTDVENLDFIWRVLRLLINRLEDRLEILKRGGIKAALDSRLKEADAEAEREAERLEASVKDAADRAKRIVAKSTRGLLKNELLRVAQTLALNAIATYVVNSNLAEGSDAHSLMSRIEPFVLLLGSANTGLLVSYLTNVKMRALSNILNYSVSMFTCLRKPQSSSKSLSGPASQLIDQENGERKDSKAKETSSL